VFDGTDSFGSWTLRIGDTVGADPIVLDFYTLTFNGGGGIGNDDSPVPLPGTLLLLATGLLRCGVSHNHRNARLQSQAFICDCR
jgi:hypothetical protein